MDISTFTAFTSALFALAIAVVVLLQGRSPAHWLFSTGMILLALESTCFGLAADALLVGEIVYWEKWRLLTMALLPGIWLTFSLVYARGNYREFAAKWRFVIAGSFLIPVGLAVGFLDAIFSPPETYPLGSRPTLSLGLSGLALYLIVLGGSICGLMNLERTYRAAVGTMAWRIKFMIMGLGLLFAVRAWGCSQALLFRSISPAIETVNAGALLLACALILRSLFRVGHFEVKVYPSHRVLANSVTLIVTGIYLMIVGVFAKIVAFFGGDTSFTLKAFLFLVLLVLFSVLALSDRVRLQTRRLVSRYFQRPLYDYRAIWRTFSDGTARCVEQTELCGEMVKLVSQTFQSLSVTIWLVDARKGRLNFAASSSLSDAKAGHMTADPPDTSVVLAAFKEKPEPVDIDASKETWASALRRLHPDEFHKGNRIAVPITSGGELLGIMIVGDRVSGLSFSTQDFDLLKAIGDQVAASLLNIQLSQRLGQAKQLEAFQMMSAFFVHDLKNTASTLSLMLKNLPVHFHDPQFREDALRGIAKTVTHVNELIARLGMLRQELVLRPVECDLNAIIEESLKNLVETPQVQLSKKLPPLSKACVDPQQIKNVFTNLLFNARDAVESGGQIRVETAQQNGSLLVTISDTGCGMTPEFLQQSLFRPFQTTKKNGIGIGMFQCKMIVEAHKGRIEAESAPGKGSTFRVVLPLSGLSPVQSTTH